MALLKAIIKTNTGIKVQVKFKQKETEKRDRFASDSFCIEWTLQEL